MDQASRIGVIGAGVMGSEIAQVAAAAGHDVLVVDIDEAVVARGLAHVAAIGARRVERGKMDAETADAIAARVSGTTSLDALADRELIVEAAPEILELKQRLWRELDRVAAPEALLASNTSGLSISDLAAQTGRPDRVFGMHFFNPASVMRLVEVIRGEHTSGATLDTALTLVRQLGKVPVPVQECPGFLVNRILLRALGESYRRADELGASRTSADAAVVDGPAPMGPFTLGDLIGLDTTLHVQRDLHAAYGDRFDAGSTLASTVAAGDLGQKTGRGFVVGVDAVPEDELGHEIAERYYLGAFDEACRCLEEGVAAIADIDIAMQLGTGWQQGPLAWADAHGLASVAARLDTLASTAGDRFAPRQALRDRVAQGEPFITTQEQ